MGGRREEQGRLSMNRGERDGRSYSLISAMHKEMHARAKFIDKFIFL